MTAGAFVAPTNTRTRSRDLHHEVGLSATARADMLLHMKYQAAVTVKVALRTGDNTDILEALGLLPTVHNLTPSTEPAHCPSCDWTSTPGKRPEIALKSHARIHARVSA